MKIFRFALISFFTVFCLLNSAVSFGFEAGSARGGYMGEYCWQDDGGGIAKLAITKIGDGHYIVSGRHTDTSGNVEAVIGNGEVVAGQLIVHLTSSSFDSGEVWAMLATIVFDLPSLNGTMEGVNVWYDKPGGPGGVSYDGAGTLTKVTCP
jgi:hypothetical protein